METCIKACNCFANSFECVFIYLQFLIDHLAREALLLSPRLLKDFCKQVLGQSSHGQIFVWTYLHIYQTFSLLKVFLRGMHIKILVGMLYKGSCLPIMQIYLYLFIYWFYCETREMLKNVVFQNLFSRRWQGASIKAY